MSKLGPGVHYCEQCDTYHAQGMACDCTRDARVYKVEIQVHLLCNVCNEPRIIYDGYDNKTSPPTIPAYGECPECHQALKLVYWPDPIKQLAQRCDPH